MIVCLCTGTSDREIGDAIRRGACSLDDVRRRCRGAGGDCGSCRADIAQQLAEGATARPAWVPSRSAGQPAVLRASA